jgi:hypothetical protein
VDGAAWLRARLGDEGLTAGWARSRAKPTEDAIALAM